MDANKMDTHVDFEKAADVLKHEHRLIEKVLSVLEEFAADPQTGSFQAWGKVLEFIREFADKCHHLKEEKIFFPALEGHGVSVAGGPLGVMLEEHELGRAYVKEMREALERWKKGEEDAKAALSENARAYLRLLKDHIQKEDEVLFVMADEVFTDEEQKKLVHQFETHEQEEMGLGVHEKYLEFVQELEGLGGCIRKAGWVNSRGA